MKKLIIIILMFIQSSCSSSNIRLSRKYDNINEKFQPYIAAFIIESKGKLSEKDFESLTMGFRIYSEGSSVVGTCWPLGYLTEIDINIEDWNKNLNYGWRKELIYHELGHCILSRGHTTPTASIGFFGAIERFLFDIGFWEEKGYLSDGCPTSIMHSSIIGSYCFDTHHDYYIEELFTEYKSNNVSRNPQSQCKEVKILNKTDNWTKFDEDTLDRAHVTCKKRYKSCLSKFIKTTNSSYQAICGDQNVYRYK